MNQSPLTTDDETKNNENGLRESESPGASTTIKILEALNRSGFKYLAACGGMASITFVFVPLINMSFDGSRKEDFLDLIYYAFIIWLIIAPSTAFLINVIYSFVKGLRGHKADYLTLGNIDQIPFETPSGNKASSSS